MKLTQAKVPHDLLAPSQALDRNRKRPQETRDPSIRIPDTPFRKRLRTYSACSAVEDTLGQEIASAASENQVDPIDHWRKEGSWPKEYFESHHNMHLLARKKSSSSFRRKRSEPASVTPSNTTPSDQKPRDVKSAPYQDPRYETLLATKGSFMRISELGITDASMSLCRTLLEKDQTVPQDSLFHDDLFPKTCGKIENRNEAKVIQDITRLIVPSAESLATFGAKHLNILIESVNEGWNNSIPVTPTRPQPDYSVGFNREAFTDDQLNKLQPFVGDLWDRSFFMATFYMYFPFLTCEVKCGAAALDVADRQNAHSMTLATRGIVELFRYMKREKELDREILSFSISHDYRTVRIYGHYAVIDAAKTTIHRHLIHDFSFTALDGKEKWTAYRFTKNIYDIWMPAHFKRICSVIDEFPTDIEFGVSQSPRESGLSQDLESHDLLGPSTDPTTLPREPDSQSSPVDPPDATPTTSTTEREAFKKPEKRDAAGVQR